MSTFEALMQFVSSWVTDPLVVNVFAIILATAVTSYVSKRVLTSLAGRLQATKTPWDDALLATIRRPLKLLIWVTKYQSLIPASFGASVYQVPAPLSK